MAVLTNIWASVESVLCGSQKLFLVSKKIACLCALWRSHERECVKS